MLSSPKIFRQTVRTIRLPKDIPLICVVARPYPRGITAAFNKLLRMHAGFGKRVLFGITRDEAEETLFMAAVPEYYPGEAADLGCKTIVIRAGSYAAVEINNYLQEVEAVPRAFDLLRKEQVVRKPDLHEIECYRSSTQLICMIKMENSINP